jgi:ribosome recycling factor
MDKAVEFFCDQLRGIRSGEISAGLIDTIRADVYEQKLPLKQLAWVTPDKDRILVKPFDPQLLGIIDKAIKDEGFNSYIFSKTQVVVSCPARFGQDRDKIVAKINKLAEEARIVIRNIRKKARQKSEEDLDKPLQKLTDEKIEEINLLLAHKVRSL